MIHIQNSDITDIINKYINGSSVLSLSHEYNCSAQAIQYHLDKNNIAKITQAKRINPGFIEDYFKIIDSKEKAYWIGWILTDGCVAAKDKSLQISLQQNDKYILELLEKDLGLFDHVKVFNHDYYKFYACSVKMYNDLFQYGIVPNKTLILKFPNNIPEKYETHLLRGMFEGDGGITVGEATRFYKHRNKTYTKPYRELSFTGTYDMCNGFQETLLKHTKNVAKKNITHNHQIYRIRWHSIEDIAEIYNVLYKDCDDHCLIRKKEKFQKIFETNNNN